MELSNFEVIKRHVAVGLRVSLLPQAAVCPDRDGVLALPLTLTLSVLIGIACPKDRKLEPCGTELPRDGSGPLSAPLTWRHETGRMDQLPFHSPQPEQLAPGIRKQELMKPRLPQRYCVLGPLGRGGQANVWLALDRHHGDRLVAVKVLAKSVDSGSTSEDLSREFLIQAGLAHPNIVRANDFGLLEDESSAYIASEHVRGSNLLDWSLHLRGPEKWRSLLDVTAQALSVIHYLSLRGLEHGDVKPANILIENDDDGPASRPVVRLIDFGVARLKTLGKAPREEGGTRAYSRDRDRGGPQVDLHGLGLSLFQAATGQLPFAIGDEDSRQRWHASQEPARPMLLCPEVHPALDEIVAGLTDPRPLHQFSSAQEALEQLKSRVSRPQLPRHRSAEQTAFPCREKLLESLARRLEEGGLHGLVGARCMGKTRVLESLAALLQSRGWRTVIFRNTSDSRAFARMQELGNEPPASRQAAPKPPEDLFGLVSRLFELRVAVLLDNEAIQEDSDENNPELPRELLNELARRVGTSPKKSRRKSSGVLYLCAAESPRLLSEALRIPESAITVHCLEPLDRDSMAAALCEYFAVEAAPRDLVDLLERASRGMPARLNGALEAFRRKGVSTDFLGHLTWPGSLALGDLDELQGSSGALELSSALRGTLGLLLLAREPLRASDCATISGVEDSTLWQDRLEDLRWRGLARHLADDDGSRYLPTSLDRRTSPGELLAERELPLRRALDGFHEARRSSGQGLSGESRLAAALNQWALGETQRAARSTLAAWKRLGQLASPRPLLDLSAELLCAVQRENSSPGIPIRYHRMGWVLKMRRAKLLQRLGRHREALCELAPKPGTHIPPWFEEMRLYVSGESLERLGNLAEAISAKEKLKGLLGQGEPEVRHLARLREVAQLARLCFTAGRSEEGLAHLQKGREFLTRSEDPALAKEGPLVCQILTLFASVEAVHGGVEQAQLFLDRALQWARSSRREDLLLGPLNELGIAFGQKQRWQEGLAAFREIQRISEKRGERLTTLRAIFNQAIIYYRTHQLDLAESLFREARRLSDELGPHALAATIWLGFASILRERGRLVEALRLYQRVLRAGTLVRPSDQAVAHNNLSEAYLSLARLPKAAAHAFHAYRISRRIGNRFLLGLSLRSRGLVRLSLGQPDQARADLGRSLTLARKEGDARAQAEALHYLGLLEAQARNVREAFRALRASRTCAREARDTARLAGVQAALIALLASCGRQETARRLLERRALQQQGTRRWELSTSVLHLALRNESPDNLKQAVLLCRKGLRSAQAWEALCALTWLLDQPRISSRESTNVRLELEALSSRMARGLSPRHRRRLEKFWLRAPVRRNRGPDMTDLPTQRTPWALVLESVDSPEVLLESTLDAVMAALGARAACIFLDPDIDETLAIVRPPDDSFAEQASPGEAVAHARGSVDFVISPPFLVQRIPHPRAVRVLRLEFSSSNALVEAADSLHSKLSPWMTALALGLRLVEKARETESAKGRYEQARIEVHKLSALVARDRQELDTAPITRASEVKDSSPGSERPGPFGHGRRRIAVAASPAIKAILERLPRIAGTDIPVLLLGESGVGKDWVARKIHELSPRKSRPFLSGICDIAESLMEAELFGYVEGAFTGATSYRQGIFERVSGGTIHLDEVSELSPTLQARLLRVLEQKEVRPLGGSTMVPVDFRLVSTSSRDLEALRRDSNFRGDFLYRLQGEVIEIPPLRKRPEDIPLLVNEILKEHSRLTGGSPPYVHPEAMKRLIEYPWPGNLRELENEILRILVDQPLEIVPEMLLPGPLSKKGVPAEAPSTGTLSSMKEARELWERDFLARALRDSGGNVSQAARTLKITRRHLGTLLEKHHISRAEFRPEKPPENANPSL